MASSFTDYLQDALLDHVLRNTAYTSPTTVYVALATAAFATTGALTGELAGDGYTRGTATFAKVGAGTGTGTNSNVVSFGTATTGWGTVSHFAIADATTGGSALHTGSLATNKEIGAGEAGTFAAGGITVTYD